MSTTVARGSAPARLDRPKGDVAGAAGEVEQRERLRAAHGRAVDESRALGGLTRGDQRVLPGPVQPARHQVVHQVVAPRDAVKDVVDQRLLVGKRAPAEAEMGAFRRFAAWRIILLRQDHSATGRRGRYVSAAGAR